MRGPHGRGHRRFGRAEITDRNDEVLHIAACLDPVEPVELPDGLALIELAGPARQPGGVGVVHDDGPGIGGEAGERDETSADEQLREHRDTVDVELLLITLEQRGQREEQGGADRAVGADVDDALIVFGPPACPLVDLVEPDAGVVMFEPPDGEHGGVRSVVAVVAVIRLLLRHRRLGCW